MLKIIVFCIGAPLLIFLVNLIIDFIRLKKAKIDKKKFQTLTFAKFLGSSLAGLAAILFVCMIILLQ